MKYKKNDLAPVELITQSRKHRERVNISASLVEYRKRPIKRTVNIFSKVHTCELYTSVTFHYRTMQYNSQMSNFIICTSNMKINLKCNIQINILDEHLRQIITKKPHLLTKRPQFIFFKSSDQTLRSDWKSGI